MRKPLPLLRLGGSVSSLALFTVFAFCVVLPPLRLYAVPLAFVLYFINPVLFWSVILLTGAALLLWRLYL